MSGKIVETEVGVNLNDLNRIVKRRLVILLGSFHLIGIYQLSPGSSVVFVEATLNIQRQMYSVPG